MIELISEETLPAVKHLLDECNVKMKSMLPLIDLEVKLIINNKPSADSELIIRCLVCKHFDCLWEDMASNRRFQKLAWARQAYCFLMRNYTKRTYMYIGKSLNRDHTTVIHSVVAVQDKMFADDPEFMPLFKSLTAEFLYEKAGLQN